MALLLIRTIILYILTLGAVKIMGKREIGQLQPYELVVILVISDMASISMQSITSPLIYSIIPMATLTVLQVLVSLLTLKSEKLRLLISGRPTPIIEKGVFNQKNMTKLRLNINDIQEMCRAQGVFDLSTISYAFMETNGNLSILLRTEKRPLQVEDLLPDAPREQLSRLVIWDGHVNKAALSSCGKDEAWLDKELHKAAIKNPSEVFIAGIDETGHFFFQKKIPKRS